MQMPKKQNPKKQLKTREQREREQTRDGAVSPRETRTPHRHRPPAPHRACVSCISLLYGGLVPCHAHAALSHTHARDLKLLLSDNPFFCRYHLSLIRVLYSCISYHAVTPVSTCRCTVQEYFRQSPPVRRGPCLLASFFFLPGVSRWSGRLGYQKCKHNII